MAKGSRRGRRLQQSQAPKSLESDLDPRGVGPLNPASTEPSSEELGEAAPRPRAAARSPRFNRAKLRRAWRGGGRRWSRAGCVRRFNRAKLRRAWRDYGIAPESTGWTLLQQSQAPKSLESWSVLMRRYSRAGCRFNRAKLRRAWRADLWDKVHRGNPLASTEPSSEELGETTSSQRTCTHPWCFNRAKLRRAWRGALARRSSSATTSFNRAKLRRAWRVVQQWPRLAWRQIASTEPSSEELGEPLRSIPCPSAPQRPICETSRLPESSGRQSTAAAYLKPLASTRERRAGAGAPPRRSRR